MATLKHDGLLAFTLPQAEQMTLNERRASDDPRHVQQGLLRRSSRIAVRLSMVGGKHLGDEALPPEKFARELSFASTGCVFLNKSWGLGSTELCAIPEGHSALWHGQLCHLARCLDSGNAYAVLGERLNGSVLF